ncbi:MAG: hypothetical protein Q8J76_10955 [Desulfobulbaceae bacterium]|nr:hypothetical protein [Desulfobulbaceae bacterium]
MKWKSPIFSDLRNKLGENVVGSMWKGRPYLRSFVVPANPKTKPQKSHRDIMTKAVANWQVIAATAANLTEWNRVALPDLISGFNKFVKNYAGSPIAPGYLVDEVFTPRYTVGATTHIGGENLTVPRNEIQIGVYRTGQMLPYKVTAVLDAAPKWYVAVSDMKNYADEAYAATDGDILYVIDNRVFPNTADEPKQLAKATSHYMADETAGIAKRAIVPAQA